MRWLFFKSGSGSLTPGATPVWAATSSDDAALTLNGSRTLDGYPAHSAGDLLLATVLLRNDDQDGGVSVAPSGFTAFAGNPYGGSVNCRFALFWKIGNGSETGTTMTCTGGATNDLYLANVHRFTAADGFHATPIGNISSVQTGTDDTPLGPSVTQSQANLLGVALAFTDGNYTGSSSFTGESGVDWVTRVHPNTSSGGAGAYLLQSGALTGNTSGGSLASFTGNFWATIGFTIRPADV